MYIYTVYEILRFCIYTCIYTTLTVTKLKCSNIVSRNQYWLSFCIYDIYNFCIYDVYIHCIWIFQKTCIYVYIHLYMKIATVVYIVYIYMLYIHFLYISYIHIDTQGCFLSTLIRPSTLPSSNHRALCGWHNFHPFFSQEDSH